MRILTLTVILALPLMALGQTAEQQQAQGQTNDTQATEPAKAKKAKPETGANVKEKTQVQGGAQERQRTETGARSSTSQTNVNSTSQTTVNVQEFKSRHTEVFSLGRHPREFFVQRFGASHVRLIGNTQFVFVDGCWVAVDVDGFTFVERVICRGDPEFIEIVE